MNKTNNQGITFRIYTQDINRKAIEKLCSKYFEGFTLYKAKGYWRLQAEKSLIIEVLTGSDITIKINQLAKAIKQANKQESILIQKIKNNSYLI